MPSFFPRHATAKMVLLPAVLVTLVCFYGTSLWTIYISMTPSEMLPNYKFVGLQQYIRLFHTPRWDTAYANMAIFGILMISGTLLLGTFLAILIDSKVRFEGVFRTILLYPLSMSFIVTGVAWQWLLSPTTGIEHFVRSIGWSDFSFDWIVQPERAIYTLVFAGVWHSSGLVMVLMLSGLRGIDQEIWRASQVEGIPKIKVYLHIVLPMLRPLILTSVVLLTTAVVKGYDLVVAMTGGGPGYASDLPGLFVVSTAFERSNIGLASAGAVVMVVSIVAALAPYLYIEISRKDK